MSGIDLEQSSLGWHGLSGDRRFGMRLVEQTSDFPWLTASKFPELLLYRPTDFDAQTPEQLPTRVRCPTGQLFDIHSQELRSDIERRSGFRVELMAAKHGIFDDALISLIASSTAAQVCQEAGVPEDCRRFRANIEIEGDDPSAFMEDNWVGQTIIFGESRDSPAVYITKRDVRCKMLSLDPDTAEHQPMVLKTTSRLNDTNAGVYGTVIRIGNIKVGDLVFLQTN